MDSMSKTPKKSTINSQQSNNNQPSVTRNSQPIEFEDAYIIEEKNIKIPDNDDDDDLKELTLNSLDLSDEDDVKSNSLNYEQLKITAENKKKQDNSITKIAGAHAEFTPKIVKREEVVEDFIRNFLVQYNLNKTLESFNQDYNDLVKKGKFYDNILGPITDVRIKNAKLEDKKKKLELDLDKAKKNADNAKSQWESLRKERDFHKENFQKTIVEKDQISRDIKALEKLHEDFSLKITDLNRKYEHLCKSKSLLRLDVEKLKRDVGDMEENISKMQLELEKLDNKQKADLLESKIDTKLRSPEKKVKFGEFTPWPADVRNNLYLLREYSATSTNPNLVKGIKAHDKSVASLAVHIKKHVVATGGDDAYFKIFNMTNYDELVGHLAHTDYISGIDIHPKGNLLVTSSGDNTISVWDLFNMKRTATFFEHNSIVWDVKFHDTGDFIVSCSEDSSIRLFDMNAYKCRQTYMGHTSSVNKIAFQPFTNYFATCSVDKTISIWDIRSKQTVQTYYGHLNTVNDLVFSPRGDMIYSCDADGVIKTWDIRKVQEMNTFVFENRASANCLDVDKSNSILYVGFDNGFIGSLNVAKNKREGLFKGHDGSVNQVGINLSNSHLYSVGADGMLNVFQ